MGRQFPNYFPPHSTKRLPSGYHNPYAYVQYINKNRGDSQLYRRWCAAEAKLGKYDKLCTPGAVAGCVVAVCGGNCGDVYNRACVKYFWRCFARCDGPAPEDLIDTQAALEIWFAFCETLEQQISQQLRNRRLEP